MILLIKCKPAVFGTSKRGYRPTVPSPRGVRVIPVIMRVFCLYYMRMCNRVAPAAVIVCLSRAASPEELVVTPQTRADHHLDTFVFAVRQTLSVLHTAAVDAGPTGQHADSSTNSLVSCNSLTALSPRLR